MRTFVEISPGPGLPSAFSARIVQPSNPSPSVMPPVGLVEIETSAELIPGPVGPTGPQGPVGPVGPAGSPDTGADIIGKLAPVDGAGSGLDADLLDGQHGSYYLNLANATGALSDAQHGNRGGGPLHAIATSAVAGFMVDAASDGVQYVRKNAAWSPVSVPPGTVISDTPPGSPANGQLWWESDTGNLFIWYDDGSSQQWVQVNGPVPSALPDAPADGFTYGRKNGVWSKSVNLAGDTMTGPLVVNSTITSNNNIVSSANFATSANVATLNTGSAGTVFLRPGGVGVTAGQLSIASNGDLTVAGTAIVAGTVQAGAAGSGIVQAGTVNIGTFSLTGATDGFQIAGAINTSRTGTGATNRQVFYNGNGAVGVISTNGSTTTYGTSSDERLKEFGADLTLDEAMSIINADPVRHFNWKADGSPAVGWSAQHSYAVSPDLASPPPADANLEAQPGDEDFQPWSVDQGKRTPYLWAAVSGLLKKIEAMEARIALLEGAP